MVAKRGWLDRAVTPSLFVFCSASPTPHPLPPSAVPFSIRFPALEGFRLYILGYAETRGAYYS